MSQKTNAVVTIDLGKLKRNVALLSARQSEEMDLMGVIKADAYGHGAIEVARSLEPMMDAFAVNDIQEAIVLREAGIRHPILVFGPPDPRQSKKYAHFSITATVSAKEHFPLLPPGTQYHLNFDTGMNRMGFEPHQANQVRQLVEEHKNLDCTGIYSHFATADAPDSAMVYRQQARFSEVRKRFPPRLQAHISNTGGTLFYPFDHYAMGRLGIGMYGYSPGKETCSGLQPVMELSSHLVAVKPVKAGDPVSYGATWKAPADGYLGVVPVGYVDGLRRGLSGQLSVRIEETDYEVAGIITMNYCMIYLGNDRYPLGTEVNLLRKNCDAGDWAQQAGTIPYEILTGISRDLPRKYIS